MSDSFVNVPGNCFLPKHFQDDCQQIGWPVNGKKLHGYCSKCKKSKPCDSFNYDISLFTSGDMLNSARCSKY